MTIASCKKQETSREWAAKKHGLFTYFLAEGLLGKADLDKNDVVDSYELYNYALNNVALTARREWNAEQTPVLIYSGVGRFALTWLPNSSVPAINRVKGEFNQPSGRTVGRTIQCSGSITNWDPTLHLWLAVEVDGYLWFKDSEVHVDAKHKTWSKSIKEEGKAPYISLRLYAANDEAHHEIVEWVKKGKAGDKYERITFVKGTARVDHVDNLQIQEKP